jgi:hypothetical protein
LNKPSLRRARSRLTYSNIIATLALFIALGGVSYAAVKLPKNSVTNKTIKKNAVTSPKIKNKTITGADVKSNTLTGSQINESTLAVPSTAFATSAGTAASAGTAGTAADTINVTKSIRSSASGASENAARAAATAVPLASHGNVAIYAKCFIDESSGATHFEILASSTADGALLYSYSGADTLNYGTTLLNSATPEDDRHVSDDETDGADMFDDNYAVNTSLVGPDGKSMYFSSQSYGRSGTPSPIPGVLPNSDSCYFQVSGAKQG